jgi:aspartate kinase
MSDAVLKEKKVEQPIISGVAHDLSEAKITVVGVPDKPGNAASIFEAIANANVNIDMIVQNVTTTATSSTDITFTCPKTDREMAVKTLESLKPTIGFNSVEFDEDIAKVSLIGAGMRSHPGVSASFFRALASADVNIEAISTSEIRISVVIRAGQTDAAVQAVHTAFGLDGSGEAVVYGGTGR